MKCFQGIKCFCQTTTCVKPNPFKLKCCFQWKDTKESKAFMHAMLIQTTLYKLDKGWFI